jgi:hypothetical protein
MALGSTLPNWPLPFPYLGHSNIEKRIQKMKCTIPLRIQKSWASAHHFMGLPLAALPLPLDHQQQGRRIFSAHLVNKKKLPSCFQLQLISDKYNNSCYVSGRHNSGISPYNWPIGTAHGKLIREIAGRKN